MHFRPYCVNNQIEQRLARREDFAFETTLAGRVRHGGHDVPKNALNRRFPRSLQNFLEDYSGAVDRSRSFMNSGKNPVLIFEQKGSNRVIFDQVLYEQLLMEAV